MRQKFFTDTVENKFIHSLLYNFNFPICNAVTKFDWITRGSIYIYDSKFIYCTKTGYLGKPTNVQNYDSTYYYSLGEFCYYNDELYKCIKTEAEIVENKEFNIDNWEKYVEAEFISNDTYIFGNQYNQYTYNYVPKYNYYDSESHKMLGKYLRCFRTVKGIDLMPFYNCYSFDTNGVLQIEGETGTDVVVGHSNSYKLIQIPIKFNTTYTIAIDSLSNIKLNCALCTKNGLLNIPISGSHLNLTNMLRDFYQPFMLKSSASFKQPFTYRLDNKDMHKLVEYNPNIIYSRYVSYQDVKECTICEFLQRYEDYLYLLIQIPTTNNSSLVILEGDYTSTGVKNIVNVPSLTDVSNSQVDSLFLSNLSLLQLNDVQSYPIADRLLEYLLQNVIGPNESINNNINQIQEKLSVSGYKGIIKDVWNVYLRYLIYTNYMDNKWAKKLDFNGLADKDVKYYLDNYVWR